MKQYLTIFRVLGNKGKGLVDELRSTPANDLAGLKEKLKRRIGQPEQLTYLEYFDAWSDGYEFEFISKPKGHLEKIETEWGSLHFSLATPKLAYWLRRKAERKNIQFKETTWLYSRLHGCLTECDTIDKSGALLLFRQPVGVSFDDQEIKVALKAEPHPLVRMSFFDQDVKPL